MAGGASINPLAELRRALVREQRTVSGQIVSSAHGRSVVELRSGRRITVLGSGRPGDTAIILDGRIVATTPRPGPEHVVAV